MLYCTFRYRTAAHLYFMKTAAAQLDVIRMRETLRERETMDADTASLIDAIRSAPAGTFKLFRSTDKEPEVEQSMANVAEISGRIRHAKATNCLIEVVELRMQYIDLWLRVYFENTPHTEKRQRYFGRLLEQCLKQGLEKRIYDRILEFNRHRVNAIHGYLVGKMQYEHLAGVISESDGLAEVLTEFVLLHSGEVVYEDFTQQHHARGDAVYDVPLFVQQLRARPSV